MKNKKHSLREDVKLLFGEPVTEEKIHAFLANILAQRVSKKIIDIEVLEDGWYRCGNTMFREEGLELLHNELQKIIENEKLVNNETKIKSINRKS